MQISLGDAISKLSPNSLAIFNTAKAGSCITTGVRIAPFIVHMHEMSAHEVSRPRRDMADERWNDLIFCNRLPK